MTRPPAPRPLTPIFDNKKRYGAIDPGNTPVGVIPVPVQMIPLDSLTNALLDFPIDMVLAGTTLWVVSSNSDSLVSIDVSDPTNLSIIGSLVDSTNLDGASGLAIDGTEAYVSLANGKLTSINITNPAAPTHIQTITTHTPPGSASGPARVRVNGNSAYVLFGPTNRIFTVDITNPAAMVLGASLIEATQLSLVGVADYEPPYLFVGSLFSPTYMTVVNTTTAATPSISTSISLTSSPFAMLQTVDNLYLYAVQFAQDKISVIDISTPTAPTVVASLTDSTNMDQPVGGRVTEDYIFVFTRLPNKIVAINIKDPLNPVYEANISGPHSGTAQTYATERSGDVVFFADSSVDTIHAFQFIPGTI